MFVREASACLIKLNAKRGSHWYRFNCFGKARQKIKPATSCSRRGHYDLSLGLHILNSNTGDVQIFLKIACFQSECTAHFFESLEQEDRVHRYMLKVVL